MDIASLAELRAQLEPYRSALLTHPVYQRIDGLPALRIFMESHVFAVWDFMALLKALQRRLCCVDVPWLPPVDPDACRLINEIVLGEESDDDGQGGHASHFELYRRAMSRCGARTALIDHLVAGLRRGEPLRAALVAAGVPPAPRRFVEQTFRTIEQDNLPALAATFAFGREDLLPDLFERLVDQLDRTSPGELGDLRYYLDRHIELDGDEHGPMAERLVSRLCGDDPERWRSAGTAAVEAFQARIELWDAVSASLPTHQFADESPGAATVAPVSVP